MQRINHEFVHEIEAAVPLAGTAALDIGCGDGKRTTEIAQYCASVTGIDPNAEKIAAATARQLPNATFVAGSAEALPFADNSFDVVFFTLSLHHVPVVSMASALNEAVRVVKPAGYVVVLELGQTGSYYDAERAFGISDGDNRAEKLAAYQAVIASPSLTVVQELHDQTENHYDSVEDFTETYGLPKNQPDVVAFLQANNNRLTAGRTILITRPRK